MVDYISRLPEETWKNKWPRSIAVLGSTGSIGTSTLEVVRLSEGSLDVHALAAGRNIWLLAKQAEEFRPAYLAVKSEEDIELLRSLLPFGYSPTILSGQVGYEDIASLSDVAVVVSAQSGAAGLRGTMAAVCAGKVVALANKESLVLAGDLVRQKCAETGAIILPVDSEHNAIFQCLSGNRFEDVRKLIITASGGPFYGKKQNELAMVSIGDALNHPNWQMGNKITIDSATLMNKGLEVIEAYHLFGMPLEKIDVVIHRQSIVHSLVEFEDGSVMAQMGEPDMKAAISYCLNWPKRQKLNSSFFDLVKVSPLTFESNEKLPTPCLNLAKDSLRCNNGTEIALNAANEVAVAAFLKERISFSDIATVVHAVCGRYAASCPKSRPNNVGDILAQDELSRLVAEEFITSRLSHQ